MAFVLSLPHGIIAKRILSMEGARHAGKVLAPSSLPISARSKNRRTIRDIQLLKKNIGGIQRDSDPGQSEPIVGPEARPTKNHSEFSNSNVLLVLK